MNEAGAGCPCVHVRGSKLGISTPGATVTVNGASRVAGYSEVIPAIVPCVGVVLGGSAGGKGVSASTSMTSVITGPGLASCSHRCAGEGSASPGRKEELAPPPKLRALDPFSVDSAKERLKSGRVALAGFVENEGTSLAGAKEPRPRGCRRGAQSLLSLFWGHLCPFFPLCSFIRASVWVYSFYGFGLALPPLFGMLRSGFTSWFVPSFITVSVWAYSL